MAEIDVRAVLQYVPLFRGRVFVVLFEDGLLPEAAVAESLLDLLALQKVGVKLALGTLGGDLESLSDWAVEMEMKAGRVLEGLDSERANEILGRGQAVLFDAGQSQPLDHEIVKFSCGIGASKLIALCDGDVVTYRGEALAAVSQHEIEELRNDPALFGSDMLVNAGEACVAGISRVHLLNGKRQGVLVDELFSNEGVGTMVYADSYQQIRELREEDIPELLAMIGRTVRATWLVPRNYEGIREKMGDYLVMTIDDNVVGCVALHQYSGDPRVELACLYVKKSHEKCGYGRLLAEAAVERAREAGMSGIFALTTKAANFFVHTMGWQEGEARNLPPERYQQWADSNRGSLVFETAL